MHFQNRSTLGLQGYPVSPKHPKGSSATNTSFVLCASATIKADVAKPSSPQPLLSNFMSSMACGGAASNKFARAAHGGIQHAQLALRSRRTQERTSPTTSTAVSASTTEKVPISRQTFTDKCNSSAPIAYRLSTFHFLVIYPGTVFTLTIKSPES
jgi:hypothetical protein